MKIKNRHDDLWLKPQAHSLSLLKQAVWATRLSVF